ncbi:MAG: lasso peptide biosynthesis B2 protein [Acidimicrobiales bacterium]
MRHDPRYVCTAAVLVPGFRAIVKFEGLRTAASAATRIAAAPRAPQLRRAPGADEVAGTAEAIARTVDAVARRLPVRSRCLPRSLALWTMLQRAGIDATLRIGLRTDGSAEAHAWVEHRGSALGELVDATTLAPFALASQLPVALVGEQGR